MIDPTQPLVIETEKQESNRNPSWFKPGESGNPNGRPPKGHSITETFKQMLGSSAAKKQELVDKIWNAAVVGGDMTAAKMIWSYMDGMPLQATDITSLGEKLMAPHVSVDTKPEEANG